MKLLGVCLALAILATTALAQPAPRRPNPCGGGNPCGGMRRPPPPPPPKRLDPEPAKTYAIKLDPDDATDGATDAKITIVDTYDYACPYCEKVRPTLDGLKAKYGKDLRIVYKQFVVHPTTAMAGALAACAANKQLGFASVDAALWDGFKDRKFDKDKCWLAKEGCPIATAAAKAAHLDMTKFAADMTSCEATV